MSKEIVSHCRGCVSSCGLIFEVEDNLIISHRANKDSLVSEGFKCIKGDLSVEFLQCAEFRYTQSQKRNPSGQLQPIDNAQLLNEVAGKISETVDRYGPRSVALYFGTAGYRKAFNLPIARQFMAAIGSPLVFSTMTIDQSAHWVVDGRMGLFATGRPFFKDTDVIVLTGTNPVISHSSPFQATPLVKQTTKLLAFAKEGGKLIVVDPRKTETARRADLHLQPKPGTDAEIFACLIHLVLDNSWQNTEFCDRYITHLKELSRSVAPFTPDFVSERSGIPVQQLEEAASIIGHARKPAIGFGTGTSMSNNANTAAHMIEALNAICGGYTRAGDIMRNPGVFSKRPMVETVLPPNRTWEAEPKLSSGHGTLYGEFPSSRLPKEILTPGETQIRVLIVVGANPMMAFGDPPLFKRAMESLDSLIVLEPRKTATTELADYVVAPPIQYEVADFNLTSSTIMPEPPVLQYTQAVVEPPPGTITEWKFFNGVANRLGHTLSLAATGFGSSASTDKIELDTDTDWTTEQLIEITFKQAGLSLEELKMHPNGMLVGTENQVVSAPVTDDGARLDVCPDDVAEELAQISKSIAESKHKYKLINRRMLELMNSEFADTDAVRKRYQGGFAPLFINPDDVAEEGFQKGDTVLISGKSGYIYGCINPDPSMLSGVVAMPHCWGGPERENGSRHVSWLVSMELEDVQKFDAMPQQSGIPVTLSVT